MYPASPRLQREASSPNGYTLADEKKIIRILEQEASIPCDLQNPTRGLNLDERLDVIQHMIAELKVRKKYFIGFQGNENFALKDVLGDMLNTSPNNIGDPNIEGKDRLSNKFMERAVVRFYSQLWNAPIAANPSATNFSPHCPEPDLHDAGDQAWGHVLTMGCTEGNLYALRNARDYLQGKYSDSSNRETHGIRLSKEQFEQVQDMYENYSLPAEDVVGPDNPYYLKKDDALTVLGIDHPTASTTKTIRNMLTKKSKPKCPVLLYSETSHYSIGKIKDVLQLASPLDLSRRYGYGLVSTTTESSSDAQPSSGSPVRAAAALEELPEMLPTNIDGTINHDKFLAIARVLVKNDHPLIINANYGTTIHGAYDRPHELFDLLWDNGLIQTFEWIEDRPQCQHNTHNEVVPVFFRPNFWIHIDGALGAAYGSLFCHDDLRQKWSSLWDVELSKIPKLPLMDFRRNNNLECPNRLGMRKSQDMHATPETDDVSMIASSTAVCNDHECKCNYQFGPIMSIAMSGHKFLGSPIPTGILVSLKKYLLNFAAVSYIGSPDTTLAGSRGGLNTAIMWNQSASLSVEGHARRFFDSDQLAEEAERLLRAIPNIGPVFRTAHSLAILFPAPCDDIVNKYSLSTARVRFPGMQTEIDAVHIFIMGHVSMQHVQELVTDLTEDLRLNPWSPERI